MPHALYSGMTNRLLWFCLGLLLGSALLAQSNPTDRTWLETALLHTGDGPERVDLLVRLGELVYLTDPGQALQYAEEAEKLARKLNYAPGQGQALAILGRAHLQQGNLRRSIRNLENSLAFLQPIGDSQQLLSVYQGLAKALEQQGRSEQANYYKQLALAQKQQAFTAQAAERISTLENQYEVEKEALEEARSQVSIAEAEKEEALRSLMEQEADLLRKELELSQLEMETTQLAMEKMALEKTNMENEIALQKKQKRNNWLIAGIGCAVLFALGLWQWFRFRQQKAQAAIESSKAAELKKVDQLKDQFLANTSHELRTPLNGIIGLAEALYQNDMTTAVRQENLSLIISAGKRLNKLVNNLLDFSKIHNERIELHLKSLELRSLVEVVIRIYQPLAQRKSLLLTNLVPANLPFVQADEDRLRQVLHNLIGNALKFTSRGSISVQARASQNGVEISVADTGIGIAKDKQEAIFQAFVQADGSIRREHTGTGLGLSISRELVEIMGGRMWVQSEPGKGAVFFFTLPTTEQQPEPLSLTDSESALSRPQLPLPSNGKSSEEVASASLLPLSEKKAFQILVVDDEPINHEVLRHHLSDSRYQLTLTHDGKEALEALNGKKKYDLVLLDIMMPRMSGFEVCQEIRKKYPPSELPVIMVTAKNQVEDLVAGLAHGANDYIAKPFSRDELLARIQTHLNLYNLNEATMRFVPNEFLHSLGYGNLTEVRLGDQVEQEVTVFFSDIRDYTSISEQMSPEENFRFVNAYVGRMGPIIREYGGFVNQYLGDGIMALFMEGPEKAIQAAIRMQEVLVDYNENRKTLGRIPIKVGMGIHTGPLIMGVIGDQMRNDTATISDTVNTASRMEGLTKFYGANLLASESTLAALPDPNRFHHRYLGKVQVKGKKIAIGVYEFIDADPAANQTLKWGGQEQFEQGLRLYYAREFEAAVEAFRQVLELNPEDKAARHYRQRSQALLQTGVPDNWTGVEMMAHK
jgi:two-component system sensor histidine kinase ChiS